MNSPRFALAFLPSLLAALLVSACAGGGGGGGSPVPPVTAQSRTSPGLVSAVAGDAAVRLEWDADELVAAGDSIALFAGTNPATLLSGAPIAIDPPGHVLVHAPLTNGVRYVFALARVEGVGQYRLLGSVLRARPSAPIYVDASANPNGADGLTPQTAFPDAISGVLTAQVAGGGNVWMRGGTYDVGNLPLFPGVDLYGGFGATFDLSGIDRDQAPTVLHGAPNQITLHVSGGNPGCVVDGIRIDNQGIGLIGLEADDTDVYLREVTVENASGRGIKLFTSVTDRLISAQLVGVRSIANGADGLFVQGPFECELERCVFANNVQEGAEFDDLLGPDGVDASLEVRGSTFAGNGTEGLDVDLAATPLAGPNGSRFQIAFEQTTFERNQSAGLLLDVDFELVAGWSADIALRGVYARANVGVGVHLDLDWETTTLVQRLASAANGGDGLLITSESRPGIAVVSASAFSGNGGFGLHAALGQVPVLASHCVFAGNDAGGFASDTVRSSAASCATWLQANDFTNVVTRGVAVQDDPLQGVFERAPSAFARVIGANGSNPLISPSGGFAPGDRVELADDGVARQITALGAGGEATLSPAPANVPAPSGFARFTAGTAVDESYVLVPGSVAIGAGMTMPGGASIDAGILGSPSGGTPGLEDLPAASLFRLSGSVTPIGANVAANQALEFRFLGGTLAPASVNATTVRVLGPTGNVLSSALSTPQGRLALAPPPGGWPTNGVSTIEVHGGVQATDGRPLAAPVAIAFRAQ